MMDKLGTEAKKEPITGDLDKTGIFYPNSGGQYVSNHYELLFVFFIRLSYGKKDIYMIMLIWKE